MTLGRGGLRQDASRVPYCSGEGPRSGVLCQVGLSGTSVPLLTRTLTSFWKACFTLGMGSSAPTVCATPFLLVGLLDVRVPLLQVFYPGGGSRGSSFRSLGTGPVSISWATPPVSLVLSLPTSAGMLGCSGSERVSSTRHGDILDPSHCYRGHSPLLLCRFLL